MQVMMSGLALFLALAAGGGESPRPPPEWLSAGGRPAGEELASPEAAMAWAALLARESSFAAASRAYEGLARRWPRAEQAEGALLAAGRAALAAGEFDRAEQLAYELSARWPRGETALDRDGLVLLTAEGRLSAAAEGRLPERAAAAEARKALKSLTALLERDRAGPYAERAALGRALAWLALADRGSAMAALEKFLADYPRSDLVPEARRLLAEAASTRARGKAREPLEIRGALEGAGWAGEQAADGRGEEASEEVRAIRETYRAIAARQAELKVDEARLYLRLRRRGAAETVLRGVLARYGDSPAAQDAAKLLEKLARE